ncbi:unnamed protein product [Timema podura]|uniref:Kazal-like domain-containing protein n=1 Tax=Timema podura TaxID=61482 RepID=A0ABN7NWA1_TIMPD|nr:unnamed protein product [Timema podura]
MYAERLSNRNLPNKKIFLRMYEWLEDSGSFMNVGEYEILYEGECKSQKECTSVNHVKYEPVCAGDGTSPAQTFSNTWALKVYNWLNNKNLIVFYDGKCCPQTECPTFCCQNYDPVCASDDVCVPETFSNLCSLNKYNCFNGKNLKVLYKGACQYKDCPTSCTREYKPVCAGDNTCEPQTFNNECLLKMFNCENNKSE